MAAIPDFNAVGEIHHRTGVVVVTRHICQRAQYIQCCYCLCSLLYAVHLPGYAVAHLDKNIVFQCSQTLLRAEHRAFELFELFYDIPFAVCQRLLADVIVRHRAHIGLTDLDIIAKYTVITDF